MTDLDILINNRGKLGRHKDTSNRFCFHCGTNKTSMLLPYGKNKTPRPRWHHLKNDKENWYCWNCYNKLQVKSKNKHDI